MYYEKAADTFLKYMYGTGYNGFSNGLFKEEMYFKHEKGLNTYRVIHSKKELNHNKGLLVLY